MKVAKLVHVSMTTRVVVDKDASVEEIMEVASLRLIDKLNNEKMEHLESIEDDIECPYDNVLDF